MSSHQRVPNRIVRELLLQRCREAITASQENIRRNEQTIHYTVEAMRMLGCTWQDIGDALGISKQAAHRKYGRVDEGLRSIGLPVDGSEAFDDRA